jgi:hypothetical protein
VPLAPSVKHNWGFNWFFLPKPKFCNLFKFAATKSIQKSISFHTFSAENCEINSVIKSGLLRAFQQHQEHLQIPIGFSVSILFSFHWENGSIINSFHTVATNGLKPKLLHHYPSRAFLKILWAQHEAPWFGRSQHDKQNKTKLMLVVWHETPWFGRS